MLTSKMVAKMVEYYQGNSSDIAHFLKVYAYARTLGQLEQLDEQTQQILEISAIIHDISCPICRAKYSSTSGVYQEAESEPLVREFLEEYALPANVVERVVYLVTHHHTYDDVDGLDYRILLEADFLVNAEEQKYELSAVHTFRDRVFRTKSGLKMLEFIYVI